MPLAALLEDDAVIVIDKPAGLLVIPDRFDPSRPTLFNAVWHHLLSGAGADATRAARESDENRQKPAEIVKVPTRAAAGGLVSHPGQTAAFPALFPFRVAGTIDAPQVLS